MRIISGKYKGLKISGYDIVGTRPTMDRVKESLFGMIQNNLKDARCLDLFAGSGSLGLEALSNGAKECIFVDKNPKVTAILKSNIDRLSITGTTIINKDFKDALKSMNTQFDLIFLDPPYQDNLIQPSLNLIIESNLIEDGLIICEYEEEIFSHPSLELIKEKKYGHKKIKIFKRAK